ncbi:Oidioi.mRNA.OKI2018_I69.chr1.g3857.t1.cds [Oikopleura dioica]|uniref:Oidioi.mRNA.OKI2018_I69.chr1.g3857.t1.cds n=1 Tax=Oikopleura dioica TaxID=34765 RepID=A0ABN7SYZ6_OIKDI|nr:Oidioi.mRNA.OKI2018_I69.chr1.g3857.t1.cds [Oikopleura dioica]
MVELVSRLAYEKILLRDLNTVIACGLCEGYLVEPNVIPECSHTFCRTCILRHFQDELDCPECGVETHPTEPEKCLVYDEVLDQILCELIPNLARRVQEEKDSFMEVEKIPKFLIRFKPSDRKSHSLPRPYVLINGDTPLNVVKLLAGDPRYLEFDNFKIKKLERTVVSWLKEDHSDQFKSKIDTFGSSSEAIKLTIRFST